MSHNRPAASFSPAHSQRLVNVKSRLKQAPRYSSLDRDLIEYQERQLFEYFVVVSLHKKQAGAAYVPELTQQFPLKVGEMGRWGLPGDHHVLAVSLGSGRGLEPQGASPKECLPREKANTGNMTGSRRTD